jgi:hypothetical protein
MERDLISTAFFMDTPDIANCIASFTGLFRACRNDFPASDKALVRSRLAPRVSEVFDVHARKKRKEAEENKQCSTGSMNSFHVAIIDPLL